MTPDGRYFVVRGRLWRMSDPRLGESERAALTSALMTARRAVGVALRVGDPDGLKSARADVDTAKIKLGERGPVWWDDDAPDENRKMVKNSRYADWWTEQPEAR
ncbi:Integrase [Sphingomonas antarctica]